MCGDNPRLTAERAGFIAEHATQATEDHFVFVGDPRHRWINPVLYPLDEAKACWRRVTAPTLWVAGRNSVMMQPLTANPDEYRARMSCFAKVREVLIDDCGHNLHHDQPEQLAARLGEFFAE